MGIKCFVRGIERELSYHSEEKTKKIEPTGLTCP